MTPEQLREYWNAMRERKQAEIMLVWTTDPLRAMNDAAKLAALNFLINQQLDSFQSQG